MTVCNETAMTRRETGAPSNVVIRGVTPEGLALRPARVETKPEIRTETKPEVKPPAVPESKPEARS